MELISSYIFLKNSYAKQENEVKQKADGMQVLVLGKSLYSYIKKTVPTITKDNSYGNSFKNKYSAEIQCGKSICKVDFIITEVVETKYLDVVVQGKTKARIVKCLEDIQKNLFDSGIRERYIDIVSYDAVSEYYCNKIYPNLNTLERNLRKLLFNIYIVHFGLDYYKATIAEGIQGKVKGKIGADSNTDVKTIIKANYNVSSRKEAEEIERLQRFFYSLEYCDIEELLFVPHWTKDDESKKTDFLKKYANLSDLSDEQLREAFAEYTPRSDWERFFSDKIAIPNIRELIGQIRLYRNSVAHFKFFYEAEFNECYKLTDQLNSAIISAIKITEEKDFAAKNSENLSKALENVLSTFASFTKSFAEITQKVLTSTVVPAMTALSKFVQENTWIEALGRSAVSMALAEEERRRQAMYAAVMPTTSWMQDVIPPCVNETQELLGSIKMDTLPEVEDNENE